MCKNAWILMLLGLLTSGWYANNAYADVIIKVRALNPLNTKEIAVIKYPLPKEISESDILGQKITYSRDHSEEEELPSTSFQISYDEQRGEYYVDDEVVLLPREVVTLEVHVKDVWVIEKSQIEQIKREVDGLLEDWEELANESKEVKIDGQGEIEEKGKAEETREFALIMKEEIIKGLDEIISRQDENEIIHVGVERHIAAYNDNIEDLRQVQQDIVLLANLIRFELEEDEGPLLEETQDLEGEQEIVQNGIVQGGENIKEIQDEEQKK